MKSYKIYYINLDKSKERNNFMQKQLTNFNQEYLRIPAVNGNDLKPEVIKQAGKNQSFVMSLMKPNAGQVGCFLSHRKAWELIKEQKEDFAILLEDDIIVHKELFDEIDDILERININDYIDLSGLKGKIIFEKNNILTKFIVPAHGTIGQIIGKNAATTLYNNMSDYITAVDNMLRFIYIYKVPIWTSNKAYISTIDDELGGSTIGYQAHENSKKNILIRIIKPFWRIAHIIMKLKLKFKNYLFYLSREKK